MKKQQELLSNKCACWHEYKIAPSANLKAFIWQLLKINSTQVNTEDDLEVMIHALNF